MEARASFEVVRALPLRKSEKLGHSGWMDGWMEVQPSNFHDLNIAKNARGHFSSEHYSFHAAAFQKHF